MLKKKEKQHIVANEKAITLIALVVTIIVMLILVGASLSVMVGDNGILTKAIGAVTKNKESTLIEELQMSWASCEVAYQTAWAQNTAVRRSLYYTKEEMNKLLSSTGEVKSLIYIENGESEVVYQSSDPRITYIFKIDAEGNVKLDSSEVAENTLANKISFNNYGDKINYIANGISDWRIFYNDGSNVFLITEDYMTSDLLPNGIGMYNYNDGGTAVFWNEYNINEIYSGIANKFLMLGYDTINSSSNRYKQTASLMDILKWNDFCNDEYADYAIGSPTLEMWIKSWNEKYPTEKIYYKYNTNGYYVDIKENDINGTITSSSICNFEGYLTDENKNLYYPHKTGYKGSNGYWLASPYSYIPTDRVFRIYFAGAIGCKPWDYAFALRPVVCLKSTVKAEWDNENEIWNLN